jgi:hypothetical protein
VSELPVPYPSLEDDMVKLVAFTIVSVRRGAERAMPGSYGAGSVVVTDRMTPDGFANWAIQRYLGALSAEERRALQPDLQYLRVDYAVPRRWPREPLQFEKNQVAVLREVRDALAGD